jgi:hypothetical protein
MAFEIIKSLYEYIHISIILVLVVASFIVVNMVVNTKPIWFETLSPEYQKAQIELTQFINSALLSLAIILFTITVFIVGLYIYTRRQNGIIVK